MDKGKAAAPGYFRQIRHDNNLPRRQEKLVLGQRRKAGAQIRNVHIEGACGLCGFALPHAKVTEVPRDNGIEHGRARGALERPAPPGRIRGVRLHERRGRHTPVPQAMEHGAKSRLLRKEQGRVGRAHGRQFGRFAQARPVEDYNRLRSRGLLLQSQPGFAREAACEKNSPRLHNPPRRPQLGLLEKRDRIPAAVLPQLFQGQRKDSAKVAA